MPASVRLEGAEARYEGRDRRLKPSAFAAPALKPRLCGVYKRISRRLSGGNCDGSECAHKAGVGVTVTLPSSEQSRFISTFSITRSTATSTSMCENIRTARLQARQIFLAASRAPLLEPIAGQAARRGEPLRCRRDRAQDGIRELDPLWFACPDRAAIRSSWRLHGQDLLPCRPHRGDRASARLEGVGRSRTGDPGLAVW